jgi:hypothetical protein
MGGMLDSMSYTGQLMGGMLDSMSYTGQLMGGMLDSIQHAISRDKSDYSQHEMLLGSCHRHDEVLFDNARALSVTKGWCMCIVLDVYIWLALCIFVWNRNSLDSTNQHVQWL